MTASFCDALLQLPGGPVLWRISRGDTVPPSEAVSQSSQFLSFSVELPYFGDSVYILENTLLCNIVVISSFILYPGLPLTGGMGHGALWLW